MVELTQIEDDSVTQTSTQSFKEPVPADFDDSSDLDSDDDFANETVMERIVALKDIIPPAQRLLVSDSFNLLSSTLSGGALSVGSLLWMVGTSALLLATPIAMLIIGEQQLMEMEAQFKGQQENIEGIAPGAEGVYEKK